MLKNTMEKYGSLSKSFHWIVSIGIIALLIIGAVMGYVPKSSKHMVYNIHKLIGISVLLLVFLRIGWALTNLKPALPNHYPQWMKLAASVSHKMLYLLILIMPISGWVMSSATAPDKHPFLFSWKLGLPIAQNKAISTFAKEIHEIFAWVLFFVLVLHIAAALYHHIVRRDNILIRMLPDR